MRGYVITGQTHFTPYYTEPHFLAELLISEKLPASVGSFSLEPSNAVLGFWILGFGFWVSTLLTFPISPPYPSTPHSLPL